MSKHTVRTPRRGVEITVPSHIDVDDVARKENFMLACVPDARDENIKIAFDMMPWISAEEKKRRKK